MCLLTVFGLPRAEFDVGWVGSPEEELRPFTMTSLGVDESHSFHSPLYSVKLLVYFGPLTRVFSFSIPWAYLNDALGRMQPSVGLIIVAIIYGRPLMDIWANNIDVLVDARPALPYRPLPSTE